MKIPLKRSICVRFFPKALIVDDVVGIVLKNCNVPSVCFVNTERTGYFRSAQSLLSIGSKVDAVAGDLFGPLHAFTGYELLQ